MKPGSGSERLYLFDLDGTLIDSEHGITACIAHAFDRVGVLTPPRHVLRGWIGPPFKQTFPTVLGDDDELVDIAITHYRERFESIGWSEHAIYDGIAEVIGAVAATGHPLAIVTTKPQHQAELIVEHLPFGAAFARVYGPLGQHAHCTKAEMIAGALEDFGANAAGATMIGDRDFDILGARANDVHAIGVGWGFGSVEELLGAGAHAIAEAPSALESLLLGRDR